MIPDSPQGATQDLSRRVGSFFSLTPEQVLDAVERSGRETTGLCYALNSLENRVYEIELVDGTRVIAKFYRPGRWSQETILDEHRLLRALAEEEVPVCAPIPFDDRDDHEDHATLHATGEGIFFALFPRTGGRSPDELVGPDFEQLGRLLGRIHNISSALGLRHRPVISPATYGRDCLGIILERSTMEEAQRARYAQAVEAIIAAGEPAFEGVETFVVHGDCHRANLLNGRDGWFFLDFDDMGRAPPVQDLWLLLPGRRADSEPELESLLRGYEQFRAFDWSTLRLIEILRALRYVRYAAWVVSRWEDPAFPRAFPHHGTESYWQGQITDLYDQLRIIEGEAQGHPGWS